MLIPVILSGGSGTRLWPLSRTLYPKQFLPLAGEQTMFQQTVARAMAVDGASEPVILCNEEHRFLVAEQLRQLGVSPGAIVLEPVGRNTAPAAAVAALHAAGLSEEALILVLPADHAITDESTFAAAVTAGIPAARAGRLITFGILPAHPETGYGYIKLGAPLDGIGGQDSVRAVAAFKEKPDLETAKTYVDSGEYVWNSGIFLFSAQTYLDELSRHAPDMVDSCRASLAKARQDLDFTRLETESFEACVDNSIDYAIMEKTSLAAVVSMDAGWSDVGSWRALWEIGGRDETGNVLSGDVLAQDTRDTYVRAEGRLVATLGVENLVIVETSDAVLVAAKDKVQDVKKLVDQLKQAGRGEATIHRKVYRPWGSYQGIDLGQGFQVKRITVNPGSTLSLQMHHHRAEHWVVVRGTARITRGEETVLLSEDQSTYIPLGTTHRLNNPGKIPLELIEVQTGSYLGEDDIVRFEDVYGRDKN